MKIDTRAMALFNIKKEINYLIVCRIVAFLSFLAFSYNFVDLLFKILNNNININFWYLFFGRTILILVVYYLSLFFDNKVSHIISTKIRNILRSEIYNKIEKLSLNYTDAIPTSSLLVINSTSIPSIELYFSKFIPQVFATIFIVISSLIIFGSISVWLSVAMIFLYPLIPISIMMIMKKSKKVNKKTFSDFLNLTELFFDRLKGFSVAKIYGKEQNVTHEIDKRSEKYRVSTMALLRHQLNSINVMDAITYISIFTMSIISIFVVKESMFIIFVIVASFECFRPLRALGGLFHISMKANVELDNIYKLLDYKEDKKDDSITLSSNKNICFKDVTFSYNENKTILKNINMTFENSTKTAIVGESGSGKSTIIKLIMGLKKANSGRVTYDDYDTNLIPFNEITNLMTVISSESYLNSDTIYNHLKINENITEKEMFDALEKVNLKNFVLEQGGLNYKLTDGASNLSGGQRQRLIAAKAILKNSYIYILDEAVSNIDDYSKKCVLDAFDSIRENKIIIIISHDLEVMKNCDNIYVLQNGEIIERGNFDELVNNDNLFNNLLTEQLNLKNKFFAKESN